MKRTLQMALFALPFAWTGTVLAQGQDINGSTGGAVGGASDAVTSPAPTRQSDTPTPFDLDDSRTRAQKRAAQMDSKVPTELEGPTGPGKTSDETDLKNPYRGDIQRKDVRPSAGSDLKLDRDPAPGDQTNRDDTHRENDKSDSEIDAK